MRFSVKIKKALFVIFLFLLLSSYIPSADATETSVTAQEICDMLNYELFTDEIYYAITQDVDLSVANIISESGVTLSWKSSDTDVMNESGQIFRDKYRDKSVTMTVTADDGTSIATRSFDFTVLSQQAEIFYKENFDYDVPDGTLLTDFAPHAKASDGNTLTDKSPTGWSFSSVGEAKMQSFMFSDESKNHYIGSYRNMNTGSAYYTRYVFHKKPYGEIVWEGDIKFDREKFPQVHSIEIFGLLREESGYEYRGMIVDFDIRPDDKGNVYIGAGRYVGTTAKKPIYKVESLLENEWSRVKIVMNTWEMVWKVYVNGELIVEDVPFYTKNRAGLLPFECVSVRDFQIGNYRLYEPGSLFYLDNISLRTCTDGYTENAPLYEILDEITPDLLTDEGEVVINPIDLSLSTLSSKLQENGITPVWTSSDETVIKIDGERAIPMPAEVDKTATLTVDLGGATKSFTFTVPVGERFFAVNDAYKFLSFECFSDEPQNAVTKNIDLTEEGIGKNISLEGLNLDISVDKPNVIAPDGTVTRGASDTDVTLSVKITDEYGYSKTKKFKATVLGTGKEVFYSENFRYPEHRGADFTNVTGWVNTEGGESQLVTTIEEENNNYCIQAYRETSNEDDYNFAKYTINKECTTSFIVNSRIKLVDNNDYGQLNPSGVFVYEIYGKFNIDGKETNSKLAEIRFGHDTGKINFAKKNGTPFNTATIPAPNTWFDMTLVFDIWNQGIDLYVDGVKQNNDKIPFFNKGIEGYSTENFKTISYFRFNAYRGKEKLGIKVDDISFIGTRTVDSTVCLYETDAITGEKKELKSTRFINYYPNNTIEAEVYVSNGTDKEKTVDVLMCVFDDGKLIDIRKSDEPLTLSPGETKSSIFNDLSWKTDQDKLTIKSFVWEKGINPSTGTYENDGKVKYSYKPTIIEATDTDREIKFITLFGDTIYKLYFSGHSWSADSTKMYFHAKENKDIYEYNSVTDEIRFVAKSNNFYGFTTVPSKNVLIYSSPDNRIVEMNIDTYEKRVIADFPEKAKSGGSLLNVTNDGKYLCLGWAEDKANFDGDPNLFYKRFPVLDLETGIWEDDTNHYYGFPEIAPCNTFMNPVYKNLILFFHANTGTRDRIWMIDTETDECKNLYVQKNYSQTMAGESVSHETWTWDGERIAMAINNLGERMMGANGAVSINKYGKDRRVMSREYAYLHMGVSPISDRWMVCDTSYNGIDTKIILVDGYSGQAHVLATVNQNNRDSIAHGHPSFSTDGKKVYFGMYNDDYSTAGIGIIDVSDIIENAPHREIISLSENCQTESVDGFSYSLKEITENGKTVYETEAGKHININYLGEENPYTTATIEIEYYAEDAEAVIEYYEWHDYTETSFATFETKTVEIPLENGGWKTAKVTIEGINLEGYADLGGDFTLRVKNGKIRIGSVKVISE